MDRIYNNILDISHNHYKYLMNLENVVGIGLGNKEVNQINTFEPCIHVLVEQKVPNKFLSTNNIIPKSYMGIKTDVIKIGNPKIAYKDAISQKVRPLEGGCGISIGDDMETGTLGCIVSKSGKYTTQYYILSNNHVLANINKAPLGTPIIQPSKEHGGNPTQNIIGHLSNFIPLKLKDGDEELINHVDCAIGKITRKSLLSNKIYDIGEIIGVCESDLELKVKKVGCVTGLTEGEIRTLGATLRIDFDENGILLFIDQIIAELHSSAGDSGSIVLNESNEAIGLLFANSPDERFSFINDINIILWLLGVDIYKG